MDLLQKQITHKTFGSGVILERVDDTITVLFSDEIGKKRFLYPEAFEHFLVMKDTDLKDAVNRDLRIKLKKNEEERLKVYKLKQEAAFQKAKEFEQEKAASKKKPAAKSAPSAKKAVMKA
jgi:hypothetical protein